MGNPKTGLINKPVKKIWDQAKTNSGLTVNWPSSHFPGQLPTLPSLRKVEIPLFEGVYPHVWIMRFDK